MFCSSCGTQLVDDAVFCQECGVPVIDQAAANTVVIPPYSAAGTTGEAAAAARKGARLAEMGLGAKILVAAACVIVAAGIVTGAIFVLNAWGAPSAPNGPTWEDLDRAVAENASLKKKLAADAPEVIEDDSPPLEPIAPGFARPPDDSSKPAAKKPEAAYPALQDSYPQPDIDIRESIVPEAEAAAAPVLPLDPQIQDIPLNPYNTQRVLVWETEYGWVLEFEEWLDGEWAGKLKTTAYVGRNGISSDTREGDHKTPAGTYNILFCYGITAPRTNLRFKRIGSGDVFVDDSDSPYYNTIISASIIGTGTSHEKIYNRFSSGLYTTCVFFDFNGDGETAYTAISGRGSVRTLRGKTKNLQNTLGDIDITGDDMATLLALLDSSKHPIIIIG